MHAHTQPRTHMPTNPCAQEYERYFFELNAHFMKARLHFVGSCACANMLTGLCAQGNEQFQQPGPTPVMIADGWMDRLLDG